MLVARIYIRVSTQEQAKEGYSIKAQKERLINYCKAKDYIIGEIYIDGGFSGSNLDRPAMNKLLVDIKEKKTDLVLVYKLDRLSRSQKDTLFLIEDKFIKNEVDFVSITENFDTTTAFGRAMIGILSVFAQLERENIKERVESGRIERAKKGLWCGTPNPPLGYDLKDNYLIVNDYEAMQVKEVFELYLQGYGKQRIQNHFVKKGYTNKYGDWSNVSSHAITRIVTNRTYVGEVSFKREWYKGIHESIIDEDIFRKVNIMNLKRKGHSRKVKHFLSGLLYCEKCGEKYITEVKNKTTYYMCRNRKLGYKQDFKCNNTIFKTNDLEEVIVKKIKKMVKNKDKVIEVKYSELNQDINSNSDDILLDRINTIDNQINKLMDLYQLDTIPVEELSRRISKLHEEKKSISREVKKEEIQDDAVNIEDILNILKNFDEVWEELNAEQKRDITSALLGDKILVNERGV